MISFKPAARENVPLLIGIDGASGSGKTFTALTLAKGIAAEMAERLGRPTVIAGIDTERGRMLHYADDFAFLHGQIDPPFSPQAYMDAIDAAERAHADVIVIDSFSHEWEGEGGVRDWADQLEKTGGYNGGPMKAPAQWKEPKLAHKKLVNKMLAARAHIIVCLRSEEKMKIEQVPVLNTDGSPKMWQGKPSTKMVITPSSDVPLLERWVPICEKRFPYEITTSFLLTPNEPGVPHPRKLQRQHQPFFPEGRQVGESTGRQLAAWALGAKTVGTAPARAAATTGDEPAFGIADARAALEEAAERGPTALEAAWKQRRMAPFRDQLAPSLDGLKTKATEAVVASTSQGGFDDGYDGV